MSASAESAACVRAKIKILFLLFLYIKIPMVVSMSTVRAQAALSASAILMLLRNVYAHASRVVRGGGEGGSEPLGPASRVAIRKQPDTSRGQIFGEAL